MNVSIFKQCKYYDSDSTTEAIIKSIRNGEVKKQVSALRQLIAEGKTKEYGLKKKELPGFTVSGTFRNGRKEQNLHEYNGNIVIDVDQLSPALLLQAEARAKQSPYTHACFISPSNEGLKIICKTTATKETHKQVYAELKKYFEEFLNLFIDESGSDIPRLCLFSDDEKATYTEASEIFNPQNILPMNKEKEVQDPQALFEHCKRYTDKKKTYSEGNRNNYIHLLANNCNRKGLSEAECVYFISAEFDLDSNEVKPTVHSAFNNIKEHNTDKVKSDKEHSSNIEAIEDYLNAKYNFRFNEVTGKLEYKQHAEPFYKAMNDFAENSMYRELLLANIKVGISKLRSILCSDFCKRYDPFLDYFNALPKWDNETDYIEQLANTIKTTNDEFWKMCFKRWLVAMVGTAIDPKTINHTVIVFSGKQGIGKTTWMINLVPKQLKDYLFSGTINPDNKDTLIQLAECMLINLDELENLNKSEIGSLKEIITKTHIRLRKAYGHNNETFFRRASFCGSVNTIHFLNDTTGSRRFLCFEVLEIDYEHSIDINNVLAQALHLFKTGYKHYFSKEEIATITANNEQYQVKTVEEELLLTYFPKPTDNYNVQYLTTSQIASKIAEKTKTNVTNGTVMTLGKMLTKHGYKKAKKNSRQVYEVREQNFDDVQREASEKPQSESTNSEDPKLLIPPTNYPESDEPPF